jgi:hypothetical protein
MQKYSEFVYYTYSFQYTNLFLNIETNATRISVKFRCLITIYCLNFFQKSDKKHFIKNVILNVLFSSSFNGFFRAK